MSRGFSLLETVIFIVLAAMVIPISIYYDKSQDMYAGFSTRFLFHMRG